MELFKMSKFALFILFVKAFFRTWKSTFNLMTLEELNHVYEKDITRNAYNKTYFEGLYNILKRQSVDVRLDSLLLEQINGQLFLPSAGTAWMWLVRFEEYVKIYQTNPDDQQHYIPTEMKSYFVASKPNTSNLEYLFQENGVCAILPFIEDIMNKLDVIHAEVNSLEDIITRDYFLSQLSPFIGDIQRFMIRTINWVNVYDRTR